MVAIGRDGGSLLPFLPVDGDLMRGAMALRERHGPARPPIPADPKARICPAWPHGDVATGVGWAGC